MDTRTTIQKERAKRKERMTRLFIRLRTETTSKSRAAEIVAGKLGCSKSSVVNALIEAEQWK